MHLLRYPTRPLPKPRLPVPTFVERRHPHSSKFSSCLAGYQPPLQESLRDELVSIKLGVVDSVVTVVYFPGKMVLSCFVLGCTDKTRKGQAVIVNNISSPCTPVYTKVLHYRHT